jgi:hypothetical protein
LVFSIVSQNIIQSLDMLFKMNVLMLYICEMIKTKRFYFLTLKYNIGYFVLKLLLSTIYNVIFFGYEFVWLLILIFYKFMNCTTIMFCLDFNFPLNLDMQQFIFK